MKPNNLIKISLVLILVVAFILRFYKLDQNPPSLSWDETAVGYNAFTIASNLRDEWGKTLPVAFTSFRDDKQPIYVYTSALSVKLLGLSEFSTRLPAALFGVFNCLLLFLLIRLMFKNNLVALFATFFLAISPFNLQFSRQLYEANFTLFYFFLGMILFYKSLDSKKSLFLILSFLSFGIDLLAYHSAKIVTPSVILILMFLYWRDLMKFKKSLYSGLGIFALFIVLILTNTQLNGSARIGQTNIQIDQISQMSWYKSTQNVLLGKVQFIGAQYLSHFSPQFLFESGDSEPRHSTQAVGEFYKIDAILFIAGLLTLIYLRNKSSLVLLSWILIAPIPASLVLGAPHAHRALFMMGSLNTLAALGLVQIITLLKNKKLKILTTSLIVFFLLVSLKIYLNDYYNIYPQKYAIEWQYGMKQIVQFFQNNHQYSKIYMTDERHQPYIFFLYYLHYPVDSFQKSAVYNSSNSKDYNLVTSFDKYNFGNWDPIESKPDQGVAYVITPSQYDGLRYKAMLPPRSIIYFPNSKEVAFYIVSVN